MSTPTPTTVLASFEEAFKEQLMQIGRSQNISWSFWREISNHYNDSSRLFHTLRHLDSVYSLLLEVKEEISDWPMLMFAVAYHDIIFNPLRNNNQANSAALAVERLYELGVNKCRIDLCEAHILATRKHDFSLSSDTNYFTDADIAIFGADPEEYVEYYKKIREEYNIFPTVVYNPGRRKVLEHFLDMPRIFKTDYFADRFEKQARINLGMELQELL